MPTARELLEQADALMRRNRAAAADAAKPAPIPPLAGGTIASPAMVSPRTIQHEPIARSLARTTLPIEPAGGPIGAATPATDAVEVAAEPGVPVLTDAVPAAPPGDAFDDVPLLTDAVEEIDVTVSEDIVDESARGEPSFWPEALRGETSLLGPAPDSLVVVPPPDLAVRNLPQASPAGRDPLGLDRPAPGFVSTDAGASAFAEDASQEIEIAAPPELEAAHADAKAAPPAFEAAPASEAAPFEALQRDAAESDAAAAAHEEAPPTTAPPVVEEARAVPGHDEARVREIAEEIGMQVLQRIDIFTDTTLRERLGERLKPVVERVSAELVDALNQHVGELLRAYVAEAIEREIETWRDRRGS